MLRLLHRCSGEPTTSVGFFKYSVLGCRDVEVLLQEAAIKLNAKQKGGKTPLFSPPFQEKNSNLLNCYGTISSTGNEFKKVGEA
ncbi:hypothetical protein [Caldilinea sp.]|jgi:hypothetical protein|uniref:hypothetical protein n=1 Tax=Caldilinea sp. TaxID=2293560 RepID=UPI00030C3893|nr:hypothetical protein [Caldilinea sp.]